MKYSKIVTTTLLALVAIGLLRYVKPIEARPIPSLILSQINESSENFQAPQFTVQMPGEPETTTLTIPIADATTEWTVIRDLDESELYAVAYTDLTQETIELGADIIIDSIKDTLVSEFNWSALNERGRTITVDGLPGKELIGTQNNQVSILRLILADRRLYALMSRSDNIGNIGQFFDSFAVQFWQPYVFEAGGFTVSLPLPPSEETETIELAGKQYTWNVVEGRNFKFPNESYMAAYTDVTPEDLQGGADELLESVGKSLMTKLPLRTIVESGREVSLNDAPGRAYVAINESEQVVAVHFYLVDQRLYALSASSEDITNISQFLNSFAIQ
ncbi:MAG TPA: hypothetical protein ACFCUY_13015 [Xenococcaceae cyanobacterium]